jgi:hypothetical protein
MRMKLIAISTGLMLVAGAALAQEGSAPAAGGPGAAGATRGATGGNRNASANAIRPGSMIVAHGQNGFGSSYPYPGLYRDNGGNGFYGPTSGAYFGQFEQNGSL